MADELNSVLTSPVKLDALPPIPEGLDDFKFGPESLAELSALEDSRRYLLTKWTAMQQTAGVLQAMVGRDRDSPDRNDRRTAENLIDAENKARDFDSFLEKMGKGIKKVVNVADNFVPGRPHIQPFHDAVHTLQTEVRGIRDIWLAAHRQDLSDLKARFIEPDANVKYAKELSALPALTQLETATTQRLFGELDMHRESASRRVAEVTRQFKEIITDLRFKPNPNLTECRMKLKTLGTGLPPLGANLGWLVRELPNLTAQIPTTYPQREEFKTAAEVLEQQARAMGTTWLKETSKQFNSLNQEVLNQIRKQPPPVANPQRSISYGSPSIPSAASTVASAGRSLVSRAAPSSSEPRPNQRLDHVTSAPPVSANRTLKDRLLLRKVMKR